MAWQLMWRNVRATTLNATLQLLVIYRFDSFKHTILSECLCYFYMSICADGIMEFLGVIS